jgi:hypothetical protein
MVIFGPLIAVECLEDRHRQRGTCQLRRRRLRGGSVCNPVVPTSAIISSGRMIAGTLAA